MSDNSGRIVISILIPSIPERKVQLNKLLNSLDVQRNHCQGIHPTLGMVQVIHNDSKKFSDGGLSIGEKRQALLDMAEGEYVCFLDDDDEIAPNYIETLLRLAQLNLDVCTFNSLFKCDGYWTVIEMRLGQKNLDATPEHNVHRNAWHICPVKRNLAKMVKFSALNHNEDWTWMEQVLKNVFTEARTGKIIHQYNHYISISEADKIFVR